MKKILSLLLVAIVALGCKKNGVTPGSRLLVASETITNYYPNDSTSSYQVTMRYDARNRLITVSYDYNSFQYLPVQYSYFYDRDDNIIKIATIQGSDTTGANVYIYSNGIPVSTSHVGEGSHYTALAATYTVADGKIVKAVFPNSGYPITENFTYDGNNYRVLSYSDGSSFTYTYGNHKSPFLYTGFKYSLYGLNYVINDNEIIEKHAVAPDGTVTDYKYNYVYNNQGYPLSEEETNNGTAIGKVVFSYVSAR